MKDFRKKIDQALKELISKPNLEVFAKDIENTIRARTRLGSGVKETGKPKEKLAALATSTKASRKRKKKRGELSDKTTPNKSNLTETGKMLDALKGRAINGLIDVSLTGQRNKRIAAYHQLGNSKLPQRKFLDLSSQDIRQLTVRMQDTFTKIVNRIFRK